MASEQQKKHLEKAREIRNENQEEIARVKRLETNDAKLREIGFIFKPVDGMDNWRLWQKHLVMLRTNWPELEEKLEEIFGPVPY